MVSTVLATNFMGLTLMLTKRLILVTRMYNFEK